MAVRFLLDGEIVAIPDPDPTATLLEHLRYRLRRTGTKEGCAEGDCGACTVLLGEIDTSGKAVSWRAVNACILFLPMLNGKALLTVESLAREGALNPLQDAFGAHHALQCGFCTPGFLMLATALLRENPNPTDDEIREAMASNICRCTGYQSILEAVRAAADGAAEAAAP